MSRFIKRESTVLDTEQRLEWSPTLNKGKPVNFAKAEKLCAELGEGWRLPTLRELFLLADHTKHHPAIDTEFFHDTKSDWYWTSTPVAALPDCAWVVNFHYGVSGWGNRADGGHVRAVRASQ